MFGKDNSINAYSPNPQFSLHIFMPPLTTTSTIASLETVYISVCETKVHQPLATGKTHTTGPGGDTSGQSCGHGFLCSQYFYYFLLIFDEKHVWCNFLQYQLISTCLVYTPTVALVITSLFGDYAIIHHSNHPSFSKRAIRTFGIQRNDITQEHACNC